MVYDTTTTTCSPTDHHVANEKVLTKCKERSENKFLFLEIYVRNQFSSPTSRYGYYLASFDGGVRIVVEVA